MYHRVIDCDLDPWGLAVSPSNFRVQIELLRRDRIVMPLAKLVAAAGEGKLARDAVAITFDDGYHDNLLNAAPVLAALDAPATLFLATGPMREARGYWWDELATMLLDAPAISGELVIAGQHQSILLLEREPADDDRRGWRAWETPRTAREALFYRFWDQIRTLPAIEAKDVMAQLAVLLPIDERPADRAMTADEVLTLLSCAPVSLGGHTVDHPDLLALPEAEALRQIAQGKLEVEALSGRTATGFAYPYGRFSSKTAKSVADAGFRHACTTAGGKVHGRSDIFTLPRVTARDTPSIDWLI